MIAADWLFLCDIPQGGGGTVVCNAWCQYSTGLLLWNGGDPTCIDPTPIATPGSMWSTFGSMRLVKMAEQHLWYAVHDSKQKDRTTNNCNENLSVHLVPSPACTAVKLQLAAVRGNTPSLLRCKQLFWNMSREGKCMFRVQQSLRRHYVSKYHTK